MSFEALQERLTALQETTAQVRELIDRLANLKFQPGSVPLGADDESNVIGELGSEISQILREEEDELELLQEEVEDLRHGRPGSDADHNRTRLKDGVDRTKKELSSCQTSFRRAQLSAKHRLGEAQRLERTILLQSYSQPDTPASPAAAESLDSLEKAPERPPPPYHFQRQQQQHSSLSETDQQTVGASSNVTTALRRTHELIAAELTRSEFAHQTLADSTSALDQLNESYATLGGALRASRELLGTLLSSQKSDTWYLQTSMYLLLATGAWLLYRRIFYVLVWWVAWLPAKLLLSGALSAGRAVGAFGGRGGAPEVVVRYDEAGAGSSDGAAVPTVDVGQKAEGADVRADPDSMAERVGKIVDGEGDQGAGEKDDGGDGEPNPKKRIWEEPGMEAETGGEKDEL